MNAKRFKCYDCGSTLAGHHTSLCEFASPNDARDLPALKGTQWWNEQPPIVVKENEVSIRYLNLIDWNKVAQQLTSVQAGRLVTQLLCLSNANESEAVEYTDGLRKDEV